MQPLYETKEESLLALAEHCSRKRGEVWEEAGAGCAMCNIKNQGGLCSKTARYLLLHSQCRAKHCQPVGHGRQGVPG